MKKYTPPVIRFLELELESGICAGSATVKPHNTYNQVIEEWDEVEEPTRTVEW